MSVIAVTKDLISKSPINSSKSKQMWTFSKQDRFGKLKNAGSDLMYFPEAGKAKRSTSFGYGNRSDFTAGSKQKCPVFYEIKSIFDKDKPQGPRFTFGESRSKYEKVFNECNDYHDKSFPSPGEYGILKPFGHDAAKFSMSGRNDPKKDKDKPAKGPGPGDYKPMALKLDGKYPLSKVKNTTNIIWGVDKSDRFKYYTNKVPGPQHYDLKWLIDGKGKNFVSKYQNSPGKTIGSRFKEINHNTSIVGPGSYRIHSDFGIYESKNKQRFEESEKEKFPKKEPSPKKD